MQTMERTERKQLADFPGYVEESRKLARLEEREAEIKAAILAREATDPTVDRDDMIEDLIAGKPAAEARKERREADADRAALLADLQLVREALHLQQQRVDRQYSAAATAIAAELRPGYTDLAEDIHAAIAHLETLLDAEAAFHEHNRDVRPWNYGLPRMTLFIGQQIHAWRQSAIEAGLIPMSWNEFHEITRQREAANEHSANLAN